MMLDDIWNELHLVLLPGLDGTGKLFKPFIDQLSDSVAVTVIAYPPDRHIPFASLADYIIPTLPTDKPLVLLGESYSGPVALSLAARDDLNIHAVILVATFARYPVSLLKRLTRFLPLSLLFRLPIPGFVIRHFCFGKWANAELNHMLRTSVRTNAPAVLARRARSGSNVDVTDLLSKINAPCLYLSASDDKMVPVRALQDLGKMMPTLKVVTIPGPHFILQTRPEKCFAAINDFLNKLTVNSS